jgi:hypothetical protein
MKRCVNVSNRSVYFYDRMDDWYRSPPGAYRLVVNQTFDTVPVFGSNGRIVCDPKGRDVEEPMKDAMDYLVQSPHMVVTPQDNYS